MSTLARHPARALMTLAAAVVLAAAGCGAPGPSLSGTNEPPTQGTATPPAVVTPSPEAVTPSAEAALTPVPGGVSAPPDDPDRRPTTTVTDWGTILDRVPEGFPVFPGAAGVDPVEGPASGAWEAVAAVGDVADWYAAAFEEQGWSSVDLGSALEDGSQVLDVASDLPECRVQATFRPAGGSTMITVLYGAGCAGRDG